MPSYIKFSQVCIPINHPTNPNVSNSLFNSYMRKSFISKAVLRIPWYVLGHLTLPALLFIVEQDPKIHPAQLFLSPFSQPLTFSIILEMKYKCLTMTSIHCGEIFSRYDQLSGLRFPFLTYTLKASYF